MLTKIALKSLRHKWRDYLVLLIGTTIAVGIFYMFSAMATNDAFLKANSTVKMIIPVFIVGEVLLGIITFVYLNFANSFLLRLRQKEYGLFSMLGATKRQIGTLLMRETLLVGVVSVILGMLLGMGLTSVSAGYLMNLIGIELENWSVVTPNAIIVTVIFFMLVFFINGVYNRIRLTRRDTLTLLTADATVKQPKLSTMKMVFMGLLGLALLIGSYLLMPHIGTFMLPGFVAIIVLNITGTYLFVSHTLNLVTKWIQNSNFGMRGLRPFLNGQLRFRLADYKRILTMIAVLFGMALGAMSVGQGYYIALPTQAVENADVTMVVRNEQTDLSDVSDVTYRADIHYVVSDDKVSFLKSDFADIKIPDREYLENGKSKLNMVSVDSEGINENYTLLTWANYAAGLEFGGQFELVDTLPAGEQKTLRAFTTSDFMGNEKELRQVYDGEKRYLENANQGGPSSVPGSFGMLVLLKSVFGGLEFMSMFLGMAFMVMLASTLMFKILSNVVPDMRRYQILNMVGVTKHQAKMAVAKDLGILFFIPMTIGLADALIGLQMFDKLMPDAYAGVPTALPWVLGIYALYYLVTVFIYQRLVLKSK
ncbi:FtsX-like permease family protein [Weissella tructae]|uniref:YxdM protein n=2 Tax=Weissella TaxID=46255 RepID=A0A075TZ70_9LACO|nr:MULTISPECIES: ABC transporter permease [Weissella]AIG65591.1 YxdM protein [Weissella tructae]AIM62906.1 YxdM protein [Weissella ceti]AIM64304.1 YxdM protein [Weissella ceti]ELA06952.1 ABC transporter permease [Weissella ceti NC36]QVV90720.1 ABC transporter permease [Weissella tructae]